MGIFSKLFGKSNQANSSENVEHATTQEDIPTVLKHNLKYISRTELSADTIARQFVHTQTRRWCTVGMADFPTGKVIVADPFYYLYEWGNVEIVAPVLEIQIPQGSYRADVSVMLHDSFGMRMCTARLKIKDTAAMRYDLARPTEETAALVCSDGLLTGFPVDGGMMCFCDVQTAEEYRNFLYENHINDAYPEYFAECFAKSARKFPEYQYEDGDFLEWTNPNTGSRMIMVHSGLGDGFYQSFWGYDELDEICELVVPMVNPDLFE